MTCNFTSFSTVFVILAQWADDNDRLFSMEPHLGLKKFPPQLEHKCGTKKLGV